MRSKEEIKDKLIELYRKLIKRLGNRYDGVAYGIKRQIDIIEWILRGDN